MTRLGASVATFVTLNLFQGPWPDVAALATLHWCSGMAQNAVIMAYDENILMVKCYANTPFIIFSL